MNLRRWHWIGKVFCTLRIRAIIAYVESILTTGIITTVAGTGEAGYSGDGMPASEANLSGPSGLAVDAEVRSILRIPSMGGFGRSDPHTELSQRWRGTETNIGIKVIPHEFSTSLSRPYGIALDGDGHLLMTDSDSHLIRRWHRQKKIITRVAGNGVAGYNGDGSVSQESSLNYPFGVAVDRQGNIYIADTFNHRIRMLPRSLHANLKNKVFLSMFNLVSWMT